MPMYLHRFHLHSSDNKALSNVFFRDLQEGIKGLVNGWTSKQILLQCILLFEQGATGKLLK